MKRIIFILFFCSVVIAGQKHPGLTLKAGDIPEIRRELNAYPLFAKSFAEAKQIVDNAIAGEIDVPAPVDAGGATHERHKKNYTEMYFAGLMYQFTGNHIYADFVKNMLLKYADLYPSLKQHPKAASGSPGRLFWQSLNEYVWVVYSAQAYDCVYDCLNNAERKKIEDNVFRKMAEFFVTERVRELDLIHNHGTWSCAATGIAGLVLNDKDLVEKALYGSEKKKEGGFIKQLETLFSPDGYYTEGAYYARYALMPFYIFAEALNNRMPELKIYEFRDRILKKGLYAALQLTYTNGAFIPINDAIKDKTYLSPEISVAVNLALQNYGMDETLLDIVKKQNTVMLNGAGLLAAKALSKNQAPPEFNYKSVIYTDGADGSEGGIGILRKGPFEDQSMLVFKYTAHGLSHGHYDKLSFMFYDQGGEVIQDYGSARFMNVEPKDGGRYLPENKTYAMTTIAHNTITVDEKSQFGGKIDIAEKHHPVFEYASVSDSSLQIICATDERAYKGVKLRRVMAMISDEELSKPIIVDIFKVSSDETHQYDLPYYYLGQIISVDKKYDSFDADRTALGKKNGYQHLWKEAETTCAEGLRFTWMNGARFYSLISAADSSTKVLFTRIGAGDHNFNLRNDPGIMLRYKGAGHVFASIIEPHGYYDPVKEFCSGAKGTIEEVKIIGSDDEATVLEIKGKNNFRRVLIVNNGKPSENGKHSVTFGGKKYEWDGNYKLIK